jgi:ribosomal-protein-serine acetyltransferase
VPAAAFTADELSIRLDARLGLRLLEETDADELYAATQANREYLARWLPWAAEQTPERTLDFIRGIRGQADENASFGLALIQDGRIIGGLGFHRVDWPNRSTSTGYWIAEAWQGQGLVTRALSALLERAFGAWGLNRVEIRAAVDNHRSRAVAARLGFREEGVLRQAERFSDRYVDLVLYAMLAAEWRDRPRLRSPGLGYHR